MQSVVSVAVVARPPIPQTCQTPSYTEEDSHAVCPVLDGTCGLTVPSGIAQSLTLKAAQWALRRRQQLRPHCAPTGPGRPTSVLTQDLRFPSDSFRKSPAMDIFLPVPTAPKVSGGVCHGGWGYSLRWPDPPPPPPSTLSRGWGRGIDDGPGSALCMER